MNTQILTIGHSAHGVDGFVALLHRHAVSAVADVRSQPFSRYAPHFNRNALQKTLSTAKSSTSALPEPALFSLASTGYLPVQKRNESP